MPPIWKPKGIVLSNRLMVNKTKTLHNIERCQIERINIWTSDVMLDSANDYNHKCSENSILIICKPKLILDIQSMTVFIEMLTIHFGFTVCMYFCRLYKSYISLSTCQPTPSPLSFSFFHFSLSQRHPVVFSSLAINIVLLYMIYWSWTQFRVTSDGDKPNDCV